MWHMRDEAPSEQLEWDTDAGSTRQEELPHTIDLDHCGGAFGYIGKISHISWIQTAHECIRLQTDADETSTLGISRTTNYASKIADFNYIVDEIDLLAVDEDHLDQYQQPTTQRMMILSEAFSHAMHGPFQFLVREQFLRKLSALPHVVAIGPWASRRWLALANLVWAIGAKWLGGASLNKLDSSKDHLVFYARARALGLDHRVMVDRPDMESVQGLGLLAFYLYINGSVTR
jgi:hypothetical protein